MISDKKTRLYFKLFRKQEKVFNKIKLKKGCSPEDGKTVAFSLTELYFKSKHLSDLIKRISETNLNLGEKDLDSLLENLIDLQLGIYIDMPDWIKDFKRPLKNIIDGIDTLGTEKKGVNIARKNIRISQKRIVNLSKKLKHYSAYYSQKKKK
jgi:hypothetical protein